MLNGTTGAAAVCCGMPNPGGGGARGPGGAYGNDVPGGSVNVGGVQIPRTAKGLLQKIGEAIDNAVHGGDSGSSAGSGSNTGAGSAGFRSNPVEFPMVNPFRPIVRSGSPVTALTAWPKRFTYKVPDLTDAGQEPDDEQSSFDGLGFIAPEGDSWPTGIALPSGPSKLQTILGTIQATLPATIGALRAAPANIYPGQGGYQNPYAPGAGQIYGTGNVTGGAVANVGSQVGGAVGNLGDTFSNIVAQHPYLILAGGAALVLLFMSPPRRR